LNFHQYVNCEQTLIKSFLMIRLYIVYWYLLVCTKTPIKCDLEAFICFVELCRQMVIIDLLDENSPGMRTSHFFYKDVQKLM